MLYCTILVEEHTVERIFDVASGDYDVEVVQKWKLLHEFFVVCVFIVCSHSVMQISEQKLSDEYIFRAFQLSSVSEPIINQSYFILCNRAGVEIEHEKVQKLITIFLVF